MEISIVIPVFNATVSLSNFVDALQDSSFLKTKKWELILVDDFSNDDSYQIIEQKAKEYYNVKGMSLHKNVGQHSATLAGILEAEGELLITMDDDGEHPIEFIEQMVSRVEEENVDVAFAVPEESKKNIIRMIISDLFKVSSRWFSDGYGNGSAFRIIKKSIYIQLAEHKMPFVFIDEILAWYTKNVSFLPCTFLPTQKKSTYGAKKLFGLYNNIMYTYSSFPAQLLTKVGFSGSIISFSIGLYYIIKKLFFKAQLGFTSIAVSILFSASILLLGLGIIAQYIYRQNKLLNNYPQFSIRSRTNG